MSQKIQHILNFAVCQILTIFFIGTYRNFFVAINCSDVGINLCYFELYRYLFGLPRSVLPLILISKN